MENLCECGCGQEVTRGKLYPHKWNRFVHGHNGRCITEETRKKLSDAGKRGNVGQFKKGHITEMTEDIKQKISCSSTGKKMSPEAIAKMSDVKRGKPSWNKGKKMSAEYCRTISENQKGRLLTDEWKRNISKAHKGKYESVKNDSKYCSHWGDEEFRNDCMNSKCENCGSVNKLLLHHIDEDKANCNPDNIMTLCRPCHARHHATLLWERRASSQ